METATSIKTELWNTLLDHHINDGWKVVYKYDNFDAGIDYDLFVLKKEEEEILFGWDNWLEGELQCSPKRMQHIEESFNLQFKRGEPENLKPSVVALFYNKI